ncbi:hypothetical protein QEW_2417 [Clostridioides difficile CD160]|nr:hypothetical protein QEW_2417 [Clostridioides difficile CD160]
MPAKGHAKIELIDSSGNLEIYEENNIVTNAVKDLISVNLNAQILPNEFFPLNIFFKGILLFDNNIEENPEITALPLGANLIGHAGEEVNEDANNILRGSPILQECEQLDNGYKFVWEFDKTQANGTIKCICLTHKDAGNYGLLDVVMTACHSSYRSFENIPTIVSADFEKGYVYTCENNNSTGDIKISRYKHNFLEFGINDEPNSFKLLEAKVLSGTEIGMIKRAINFSSGGDGYIYGFSTLGNSTGNATLNIIKISEKDFNYTEESVVLENTFLYASTGAVSFFPVNNNSVYLVTKDAYSFYKYNFLDKTIKLLESDRVVKFDNKGYLKFSSNGGSLYSKKVVVINDKVKKYIGEPYGVNIDNTTYTYNNYFVTFYTGSNTFMSVYHLNAMLTTINNLTTPIEKTSDKTMKIIYTITDM